jgi:hypothetical protein
MMFQFSFYLANLYAPIFQSILGALFPFAPIFGAAKDSDLIPGIKYSVTSCSQFTLFQEFIGQQKK